MRFALAVTLCMALSTLHGQPAAQPHRHALLIANGNYAALPPLASPAHDVNALRAALADSGFNVRVVENVSLGQLLSSVEKNFLASIQPGDICFFFYAGHAIQVDGDDYILPVDFDPKARGDINVRARSVTGFLQQIDAKGAGLKMFALDASRNVPQLLAGFSRGLTEPDLSDTQDVIFSLSADRDAVALDVSPNQPDWFADALAKAIAVPGSTAAQVFLNAQSDVARRTANKQVPRVLPKATSAFTFRAAVPVIVTSAPNAGPGKNDLRSNRGDRQEYVLISPGKFLMGCAASDTRCDAAEKPQHAISISHGFWMGRTEVEISAYQRFVELDKQNRKMPGAPGWDSKWKVTNHPVSGMNWEAAQAYCAWAGGRLPTEAEWEYAARAGGVNEIYPLNAEDSRDKANFAGTKGNDRADFTAAVRSYDQNAFGLYDMAGNVWEWTADWFAPDYYATSPAADPVGPTSGKEHVVRGGSWDSDPKKHLRLSFRQSYSTGGNKVGFRCVLEDTQETRDRLR